jgi:uncharacterized protein (DUF2147 family)
MKRALATGLLLLVTFNSWAATPVGVWKTIDDVTHEPKSYVEIKEGPHHELFGQVTKLFKDPDRLCVACEGKEHNQPIVGLVVMDQLKQNPDKKTQWEGGEILDPKNGKRYHCTISLLDDGQQLKVRGYIGLPLFGRNQTWVRV